jgi:hypothetical protein
MDPEQLYPVSTVHVLLQPSPFEVSPSSQASLPTLSPSPQIGVHSDPERPKPPMQLVQVVGDPEQVAQGEVHAAQVCVSEEPEPAQAEPL